MFSLRSSALSWVYSRDIGADILAYVLAVAVAAVRRTSLSMRTRCRWNDYKLQGGGYKVGDRHVVST